MGEIVQTKKYTSMEIKILVLKPHTADEQPAKKKGILKDFFSPDFGIYKIMDPKIFHLCVVSLLK